MSLTTEIRNEVKVLGRILGMLREFDAPTRYRMLRWLSEKNASDTAKAERLEAEQHRMRAKKIKLPRKP